MLRGMTPGVPTLGRLTGPPLTATMCAFLQVLTSEFSYALTDGYHTEAIGWRARRYRDFNGLALQQASGRDPRPCRASLTIGSAGVLNSASLTHGFLKLGSAVYLHDLTRNVANACISGRSEMGLRSTKRS